MLAGPHAEGRMWRSRGPDGRQKDRLLLTRLLPLSELPLFLLLLLLIRLLLLTKCIAL